MTTYSLNQNPNNIEETQRQSTRVTISHVSSSIYSTTSSLFRTRSSTDEFRRINEKHELDTLNNRFLNYLDRIKIVTNINTELRRQVDNIYRKSVNGIREEEEIDKESLIHKYQNSSEIEFNKLRKQLNNEIRGQISTQIRLQRAEYDRKFYAGKIKLWLTSDQIQIVKQQFEANLHELDLLKKQYEKQKQDLQLYKNQYNEYMRKLIDYTNEYDSITFERMQSENCLYTLKEQLLFEREYNYRREQELENLEQIQYDLNDQFNKTEFENIIAKIRQDYEKYNEIQIFELEIFYQGKFDLIGNEFKKEDHREEIKDLIQQNQSLEQKSEQLENHLHNLIERNRQQYETSNDEYNQLQIQLPELESLIIHLRDNTVHLWSEINTYRCLLISLVSSSTQQKLSSTNQFIVHIENGIIWVRI